MGGIIEKGNTMSWGRVGRTQYTSAVTVPNVSATGYDAGDAIGTIFSATYAVGTPGGLLGALLAFDRGSGTGAIRFHFWSESASGSPHGTAWGLAPGDVHKYLGFVDVAATAWQSANAASTAYFARILDQNLPLWSTPPEVGSRTIWGQCQALANFSAWSAGGLSVKIGVLQD
jgi:hypothetical protein